jgi:hypothetical protein
VFSVNEEYDNKHVTELESRKEKGVIPEKYPHLFMDKLSDGQQTFPLPKYNV